MVTRYCVPAGFNGYFNYACTCIVLHKYLHSSKVIISMSIIVGLSSSSAIGNTNFLFDCVLICTVIRYRMKVIALIGQYQRNTHFLFDTAL